MKKIVLLVSVLAFAFTSCESDDDSSAPRGDYDNGILISHEGSTVSGSVSYVPNNLKDADNDIYQEVNDAELGTFQQSIGFNDDEAFVIVDNANTVAVVNRFTFEEKAVITEGLERPRYIAFIGNKGFVTNWGNEEVETDDFIAVIDLATDKVTSTIPVALGPEQIIVKGDKLYVSHKGARGTNNIVSVIDTANGNSVKKIETFFWPDEMVLIGNDLWVSCEGNPIWRPEGETKAAFQVIDTTNDTIKQTIEFEDGVHPSVLDYENGQFYYVVGNEIFNLSSSSTTLPSTAFATADTSIYGMSVNEGKIYTVDAGDYVSAGTLNVYTISNEKWSDPVSLGVLPAKIYFQ